MSEARSRKRLLVVDDEESILRLLECTFRPLGYEVCKAADVFEAIRLCKSWRPDCIISDYCMEEANGSLLVEEVSREYPEILRRGDFVILTGYPESISNKMARLGVRILKKPARLSSLQRLFS